MKFLSTIQGRGAIIHSLGQLGLVSRLPFIPVLELLLYNFLLTCLVPNIAGKLVSLYGSLFVHYVL